ncbi:MAG: hypothetical protein ACKO83_06410 [Roseiflexaceae bacterium]
MTSPQLYAIATYIQFDTGKQYYCPTELVVIETDPARGLVRAHELLRAFAVAQLDLRRNYRVQFMVCIGTTPQHKWYHDSAQVRVNYRHASGRHTEQVRISMGTRTYVDTTWVADTSAGDVPLPTQVPAITSHVGITISRGKKGQKWQETQV